MSTMSASTHSSDDSPCTSLDARESNEASDDEAAAEEEDSSELGKSHATTTDNPLYVETGAHC
jgi:hypothetical protein